MVSSNSTYYILGNYLLLPPFTRHVKDRSTRICFVFIVTKNIRTTQQLLLLSDRIEGI